MNILQRVAGIVPVLVGMVELRIPQDREGQFKAAIFEHYQRGEKALESAMMEIYIQGVSTRNVSKITEELCGVNYSAVTVSNLTAKLDKTLFASV